MMQQPGEPDAGPDPAIFIMLSEAPLSRTRSVGLPRPLSVWLAGRSDWPGYAAIAERVAGEVATGDRGPTLMLHELEPCITIGRGGSRADIRLDDDELRSRQLPLRFTGRGGGAVLHGPGQICLSFFARLGDLGLDDTDAGGYLERLATAIAATIQSLRCGQQRVGGGHGIRGRTGLLAAIGVAIRRGCVAHGAFLNVSPAVDLQHRITSLRLTTAAGGHASLSMSSIEADVQRRVRLQDARTSLVQHVTDVFRFDQPLINAGFPVGPLTIGPAQPECVSHVG